MKSISSRLGEFLLAQGPATQLLKELEKKHAQGHRFALLEAFFLCAHMQAVIPDWAVDGIAALDRDLASGDIADLNEAFGWQAITATKRKKLHRQHLYRDQVLAAIMQSRLNGGTLNAEEAFQPVAEQLGIPRRMVEAIYKKYGDWIKGLPRNSKNAAGSFSVAELPFPRRRGRPTLSDRCEVCGTQFGDKTMSDNLGS